MIFTESLRLRLIFSLNPKNENKWNLFKYLIKRKKRKVWRASLKNFGRQIKERVFRNRRVYMRKDPKTSTFWEYMTDERYRNPESRWGRIFRRRFRVPYPMFTKIVDIVRSKGWFNETQSAMQKRFKVYLVPLEIKILGVLRILGRGVCLDTTP